jgi:hypothetical protein
MDFIEYVDSIHLAAGPVQQRASLNIVIEFLFVLWFT